MKLFDNIFDRMRNVTRTEVFLFAVLLGCCLIYLSNDYWNYWFSSTKIQSQSLGISEAEEVIESYGLRRVIVKSGHEFTVLFDNRYVDVRLAGVRGTLQEAKDDVIVLLNGSTGPRIVLRNRSSVWEVDFFLTHGGKEISLTDWLITRNLVIGNE